jgi:hypothetical protein
MLVLPTNDALSNTFQLLISTVRDFYSAGRVCVGAALKPEICKRANFTFNEQLFGFARFGDFLRAAAAAGHVQLSLTPGGDIAAWPAGVKVPEWAPQPVSSGGVLHSSASALPTTSPLSPSQPVRVRQDLWNAFTSFAGGWFYDPAADIARRDLEGATEPQDHSGLISIPIARERTIEWMRSFAGMQDAATKAQLLSVLTGDAAPYHFNNAVRSDPRLLRAWRRFHIQQVLAAIEAWAASNSVRPKNVTAPFYWSVRPGFAPAEQTSTSTPYPMQQPPASPYSPQLPTVPAQVPPQPLPSAAQLPPHASTTRISGSPLTGRMEALIDDLIEELVKLRGYIQIVRPGE